MKLRITPWIALAAVAFVFLTPRIDAANVPDPVSGDLFIGFRASGGTGGSSSLLVKIGPDTSFPTVDGTSFTLSLGNFGADLVDTYGANWNTRTDVFWSVFGTRTNSGSPIVYGSKERDDVNTPSIAWSALSLDARNSVDTQINSVLNNVGGYRGGTATSHSAVATVQANTTAASSYAFQVGTDGTSDFGSLSQWTSIEGNFGDGAVGSVLDLYRISGTAVTSRGSFSITNAGVVSYAYSNVPEPSSTALILATSVTFLGWRFRRPSAAH